MMWDNTEDNLPLVRNRRVLCDYVRVRIPVRKVKEKKIWVPASGRLVSVSVDNDVCILRFEMEEKVTLSNVRNWRDLCDYVRRRTRVMQVKEITVAKPSGASLISLSTESSECILRFESVFFALKKK